MDKKISRRNFIQKTGLIGAFSLIPTYLFSGQFPGRKKAVRHELAVISGDDIFHNTLKAIDALGGMKRFVKKNQKVGILVNSAFENRGAFVHPDVALATVKACFEQGAGEVICIQNIDIKYWQKSSYYNQYEQLIEKLNNCTFNKFPSKFNEDFFVNREINGKSLEKAVITKKFLDCDILINISIAKHHASAAYTGALKNTMGICTRDTNVTFHINGPARNDPEYLAQCIADLNTIRKPDLTIIDATEVIITNGPSGPGEILSPGKVIAGTDIVATDSLATTIIGHELGDILTIKRAWELGLGEMDYTKYKILYA